MVDWAGLICYHIRVMTHTLPQFDREAPGSLYDRGSADSYYQRDPAPHWYPAGTLMGNPVVDLSHAESAEYMIGYQHNEKSNCHKEW